MMLLIFNPISMLVRGRTANTTITTINDSDNRPEGRNVILVYKMDPLYILFLSRKGSCLRLSGLSCFFFDSTSFRNAAPKRPPVYRTPNPLLRRSRLRLTHALVIKILLD